MKGHYNKDYYDWQKKAGLYGANQDVWMYSTFVKKHDSVLDFGCGGGYILEKLTCELKYGVDINFYARKEAKKRGITVFKSLASLPSSLRFDYIICHHTLEHVENPVEILKQLRNFLKNDGKLICVVPIDDWRVEKKYDPVDINQHLYTWTPRLLGNLFVHSKYKVEKIDIITQAWVPLSRYYYHIIPRFIYSLLSKIWSMLTFTRQIRIIARL